MSEHFMTVRCPVCGEEANKRLNLKVTASELVVCTNCDYEIRTGIYQED